MSQGSPTLPVDIANHLLASRYLTGGFLAVLLWDHLTTLDREVNLIWKSRGKLRWMLRLSFSIMRYGSELFLVYIAFVTSGIRKPSPGLCKSSLVTLSLLSTVIPQLSQFVFMLRIYKLTDKRRLIMYGLTALFLICSAANQTFSILTAVEGLKFHYEVSGYNLCTLMGSVSRFSPGIMAPVCTFDVIIITYSIYDGLSRPRKRDSEVLLGLYKGGAKYFLAIALNNLICLMTLAAASGIDFLITIYPGWALFSIASSRLHFEMEQILDGKYNLNFEPI